MMRVMEGNHKRGSPCRDWLDDIGDWCQKKIHMLSRIALSRDEWSRPRVKYAFDTYEPVAHGS